MSEIEFIRNLHSNYLRLQLREKPEEKRYQYCILSRGGIKGLLDCELRYMDADAFLYYDITSRQSIWQLHAKGSIRRIWVRDFFLSLHHLQQELERFLLEEHNCIWEPEYVFQDLERNNFYFVYVPYYEEQKGMERFWEFLVDRLDYSDEELVECVYRMYEQYEEVGEDYLQSCLFADIKRLEALSEKEKKQPEAEIRRVETLPVMERNVEMAEPEEREAREFSLQREPDKQKQGLRGIFDGKRKKERQDREQYRQGMQQAMRGMAVAEEVKYVGKQMNMTEAREEYGNTVYLEEQPGKERIHRLYTVDGKVDIVLPERDFLIGKKQGAVDLVLADEAVSRLHAKLIFDGDYYLEDMNSTNGTYKNGVRLLPYEKRLLEPGDEIGCGKVLLIFK